MIYFSSKLLLQVVNDGAGSANCCGHVTTTEAIEGFNSKMLTQSEAGVFRLESKIVISERAFDFSKLRALTFTDQQFCRGNASEIIQE